MHFTGETDPYDPEGRPISHHQPHLTIIPMQTTAPRTYGTPQPKTIIRDHRHRIIGHILGGARFGIVPENLTAAPAQDEPTITEHTLTHILAAFAAGLALGIIALGTALYALT